MKNFEITDKKTDKKYWISRSVAVCPIVVVWKHFNNEWHYYVLINKRGQGTPDFQGCWNFPCGYLDWDETTSQACSREVLEECRVYIPEHLFKFDSIEDDPIKSNRQNITIIKIANISYDNYLDLLNAPRMNNDSLEALGEVNEVEMIELMELTPDNIEGREWAFNHQEICRDLYAEFVNNIR